MSEQDHDRAAPRPLTANIVIILVVGVVLLVLGIWTGGNQGGRAARAGAPDSLVISAPADSDEVAPPLEISFSTNASLRLTPSGWQAGPYHIHAVVDTAQVMPGTMDIRSLGQGQFTWRLAGVQPGTHQIRLVWARPDHRTIPDGASAEITVTVAAADSGQTEEKGPALFRH